MEILAHRGLWRIEEHQNSLESLILAFKSGFGIETDVRDFNGDLVLSHDIPDAQESYPTLEALFMEYLRIGCSSTIAINIKSDGLQDHLKKLLSRYEIKNYFVFDMSIPEAWRYINQDFKVFIRKSDVETVASFGKFTNGIWIDELVTPWITSGIIMNYTSFEGALAIVSPELHCRDKTYLWSELRAAISDGFPMEKILLCTDFPVEARSYFNGRY